MKAHAPIVIDYGAAQQWLLRADYANDSSR